MARASLKTLWSAPLSVPSHRTVIRTSDEDSEESGHYTDFIALKDYAEQQELVACLVNQKEWFILHIEREYPTELDECIIIGDDTGKLIELETFFGSPLVLADWDTHEVDPKALANFKEFCALRDRFYELSKWFT